jgi:hypothetical protein
VSFGFHHRRENPETVLELMLDEKIARANESVTSVDDLADYASVCHRLGDRTNKDPVSRLIQLVQTLRDDPSS